MLTLPPLKRYTTPRWCSRQYPRRISLSAKATHSDAVFAFYMSFQSDGAISRRQSRGTFWEGWTGGMMAAPIPFPPNMTRKAIAAGARAAKLRERCTRLFFIASSFTGNKAGPIPIAGTATLYLP